MQAESTLRASVPATVFGLDVYADAPVPLLGKPCARATGRDLRLHVESDDAPWSGTTGVLCDERTPDGSVNFRIETDRGGGYLIWGPEYGRHVLSHDGREVHCCSGESVNGQWQRLLIAQVLPFAALLGGLEVFHASAVVLDGYAIGLAGPSGSGKTSIAVELCRLGATFLADDVLALEIRDDEILAHPGTPVAGVSRGQPQPSQTDRSSARIEEPEAILTNARERLIAVPGVRSPAPLAALFFIDRRAGGPQEPHFDPVLDPQMLLAATFNFVLNTGGRLRGLLDVCSLVAARRVERISADASLQASHLAAAIMERLGTELP